MLTKLFLDDCRPVPDSSWQLVTTAAQCIAALETQSYDCVSLDHDLGPEEAGTGYDVLLWLEKMTYEQDRFLSLDIQIHTANPVARVRMQAARSSIFKYRENR